MQTRPVLLLIDVEPDTPYDCARDRWIGTEQTFREMEGLRRKWEHVTGEPVVLNWFLRCDPQIEQIWGRDHIRAAFPDFVARLRNGEDFAGIHPHFWRWSANRRRWFNDFTDPGWKEHCVLTSISGFESMVGRRPAASRFGDRWMDQGLMDLVVREGIHYDLTMEPGTPSQAHWCDLHATSWIADFRGVPQHPYRPTEGDYRKPRRSTEPGPDLWIIPGSKTQPAWGLIRRFPPLMRFARSCNLSLWPRLLQRYLRAELDRGVEEPLVLVLRSGDLASPRSLTNFRSTTAAMMEHPGLQNCRFVAVPDALPRRAEPVNCAGTRAGENLALRR